ncbi:hypothetical protein BKA64DRAFT_748440 [Cadophora sp. MPI-SDFR-AT-0126]|nr:hypothetical protein BKA64DRAFT_748440 [Leotiomycetes sp. MPI-SDFR-AT-0126]
MSLSSDHSRKSANPLSDLIASPSTISSASLFQLSQRELSRHLPASTSPRATFSIYIRWLAVHRQRPSSRTEHWSNTIMHWCQSLKGKGFGVGEVVEGMEEWKREVRGRKERGEERSDRKMPGEEEIRRAFEEDPKAQGERKAERERMGDSYRSESRLDGYSRKTDRRGEDGRRVDRERDSRREALEESWKERVRERKYAEQTKFDGPPPPNYVCNRCNIPGHHLQVCPTNLDPSYDQPPDENYTCEICHKRGSHFKSLCPQNTDPYSIIQKRKAGGTVKLIRGGSSQRDEWERESRAHRERERERHARQERRSEGRLTAHSSSSSARNTPTSGKKKELIDKVQEIEDKTERLFCEESDDIGDMIRENTAQRSSDSKRSTPINDTTSIDSPTSNTIHAKKKVRRESEDLNPQSRNSQMHEQFKTPPQHSSHDLENLEQGSDTNVITYADHSSNQSRKSTPSIGFALRPIGLSPGSMISDNESSDGMDIDELISRPHKEYSPFVQNLMRKRPEMNEVVNIVKKRKTARGMWMEADNARRGQPKTRSPSVREYGRLTPVAHDEVMKIQYDGACDDFDYDQTQDQTMTSAEQEVFPNANFAPTHSRIQTSGQFHFQEHAMASTNPNPNTNSENPSTEVTTRSVHFHSQQENGQPTSTDPFRGYAAQQRPNAEQVRIGRAQNPNSRPAKSQALKDFSTNFKLNTPLPQDLVSILAKDSEKQKEIQDKSKRDVEGAKSWSVNGNVGSEAGLATQNN